MPGTPAESSGSKDRSKGKSRDKSKEKSKGSTSTKESLLLAAEMANPPATPSFEGKGPSSSMSPPPATPFVPGVVPVQREDPDVMGRILQTMDLQHQTTVKMFGTFMTWMSKLMESKEQASTTASSSATSTAPKKRKLCSSPQPPVEPQEAEAEEGEEEEDFDEEVEGDGDEEEELDVIGHLSSSKFSFAPTDRQLEMWLGALKLDPSYGKDTWSKLKIGGTVKKWTGNPLAQPFTVPEVEAGIPP